MIGEAVLVGRGANVRQEYELYGTPGVTRTRDTRFRNSCKAILAYVGRLLVVLFRS